MSGRANRKTKRNSPSQSAEFSTTNSVIHGLVYTTVFAVVLLALFTAIVYSTPDPGSLVIPAAFGALYIATFLGGLTAAWKNNGDALLCGILTGGAFFLVLILLSLIIPDAGESSLDFWASAGLHALAVVFSILGAFAGMSLRASGKRRRRTNRR